MQDEANCRVGYFIFPGGKYMSSFPHRVVHLLPLTDSPQFCSVALIYVLSTKIFASMIEVYSTEKLRME